MTALGGAFIGATITVGAVFGWLALATAWQHEPALALLSLPLALVSTGMALMFWPDWLRDLRR